MGTQSFFSRVALCSVLFLQSTAWAKNNWCIDPANPPCGGAPGTCVRNYTGLLSYELGGFLAATASRPKQRNFFWRSSQAFIGIHAQVCDQATVGPWTRIDGFSQIRDNVKISMFAQVRDDAQVFGNASVKGHAEVFGNAQVFGNASVLRQSRIYDEAKVFENATVADASVFENATVFGFAGVNGKSKVYGDAQIFGNALISKKALIYDQAQIYGYANVESTIYAPARVGGHAQVYGSAYIGGSWILSNAQILGQALVYESQIEGSVVIQGRAQILHEALFDEIRPEVNLNPLRGRLFEDISVGIPVENGASPPDATREAEIRVREIKHDLAEAQEASDLNRAFESLKRLTQVESDPQSKEPLPALIEEKGGQLLHAIARHFSSECSICSLPLGTSLSDAHSINPVSITSCGHVFCSQCLGQWLKIKPVCPLCRRAVEVQKMLTLKQR